MGYLNLKLLPIILADKAENIGLSSLISFLLWQKQLVISYDIHLSLHYRQCGCEIKAV